MDMTNRRCGWSREKSTKSVSSRSISAIIFSRAPAARGNFQQQFPALRPQSEYRRQQLRRNEICDRTQLRAPFGRISLEDHHQPGAESASMGIHEGKHSAKISRKADCAPDWAELAAARDCEMVSLLLR